MGVFQASGTHVVGTDAKHPEEKQAPCPLGATMRTCACRQCRCSPCSSRPYVDLSTNHPLAPASSTTPSIALTVKGRAAITVKLQVAPPPTTTAHAFAAAQAVLQSH